MSLSYLSVVPQSNVYNSNARLEQTKQETTTINEEAEIESQREGETTRRSENTRKRDYTQTLGKEYHGDPHAVPDTIQPLSSSFLVPKSKSETYYIAPELPLWACPCTSPFLVEEPVSDVVLPRPQNRRSPIRNLLRRREKSSNSQTAEESAQRASPKSFATDPDQTRCVSSRGRRSPSTAMFTDVSEEPSDIRSNAPSLNTNTRLQQYSSFVSLNYDSARSVSVSRCASPAERPTPIVRETNLVTITGDPNGFSEFTDPSLPFAGQVNDYQLQHEIGRGTFGKVVLARHNRDNKHYAIKIVSKTKLKRKGKLVKSKPRADSPSLADNPRKESDYMDVTRRELAVLKKISNHPNICRLVEILDDESEENLYLVFELCLYGPVMKLDSAFPTMPFDQHLARRYFRDILLGLEFLHQQMIIHRDLKPENLLLTMDNHVQLVDFGIAQFLMTSDEIDDSADASWFKNLPGSPMFMPPEVCVEGSTEKISPQCDIWSLGITLYIFTHGHCPFENDNYLELANQIQYDEPVYNDLLPLPCRDLMDGMLRKDAKSRSTIADIKAHDWVTQNNKWAIMSTEENCRRYIDPADWSSTEVCGQATVTQEEVDCAVTPVVSVFGRLWDRLIQRVSRPGSRNKRRMSENSSTLDRSSNNYSASIKSQTDFTTQNSNENIHVTMALATLSEEH